MKTMPFVWAVFLVLIPESLAYGATLYVSPTGSDTFGNGTQGSPFRTIQRGIDAARLNDTVEVAEGIYLENVDFRGKSVVLTSSAPGSPEVVGATVIDGNHAGSAVTFAHGEGPDTAIIGFTIRNGSAPEGGGIYCRGSSPSINWCVITDNEATSGGNYSGGGGIGCRNASPSISFCTVTNNTGYMGGGIGVFFGSRATMLGRCEITNNTALSGGGGVCFLQATGEVGDCLIADNTSEDWDGGGILGQWGSRIFIRSCEISGNTANGGGGIALNEFYPRRGYPVAAILDCTITANNAVYATDGPGGGISILQGAALVSGTVICGNRAEGSGGGVCARQGLLEMVNCTLDGNLAENGWGGGAAVGEYARGLLRSSILTANEADAGAQAALYHSDGALSISYCDIEGGESAVYDSGQATRLDWLFGNMDEDPLYASPGYWDDNATPLDIWDDTWNQGDYHVQSATGRWDPQANPPFGAFVQDAVYSPCIDKGDPLLLGMMEPMPNGGRANMGAYGGRGTASMSPFYGADVIAGLSVANSHPRGADEAVWPYADYPPVFFWVINSPSAASFLVDISTDESFPLLDRRSTIVLEGAEQPVNVCPVSVRHWKKLKRLAMNGGGVLYWRVRAFDGDSNPVYTSNAVRLVIDPGDWAVAQLDLSSGASEVSWEHTAQGYVSYRVQFSVDAGFQPSARYTLTMPAKGVAGSPFVLTERARQLISRFAVRKGVATLYYRIRAEDANKTFFSYSESKTVDMP